MAKRKRRGRPIDGILVLDKPAEASSNEALQEAKRLFYAAKAGHTGSLDPLATGVLPLCFGEATKFSQFLLDADKTYVTTICFGAESSTGDADGEISDVADASSLTELLLREELKNFMGVQQQVPPMYSALKVEGQRLYELARKGEEVERKPRTVRIERAELLGFEPGAKARAKILLQVSKGTYIRSIASDLGAKFKVGAYVVSLRRTQSGPYAESDVVSLDDLRELKLAERFDAMDAMLKPVDSALAHLPLVELDESSGFYIRRGQPVRLQGAPTSGLVRLLLESGEFIGIGEIDDEGRVAPKRLIVSQAS